MGDHSESPGRVFGRSVYNASPEHTRTNGIYLLSTEPVGAEQFVFKVSLKTVKLANQRCSQKKKNASKNLALTMINKHYFHYWRGYFKTNKYQL